MPEENCWTLWCKGRLTEADANHPAKHHSIQKVEINEYKNPHNQPYINNYY